MLPTDVPLALTALAERVRTAAEVSQHVGTVLVERTFHHSTCVGDGSIRDLLLSDQKVLSDRSHRLLAVASGLDQLRVAVTARLSALAADEARVRARLASPTLTAAQAAMVHGNGPWVSTVAGAVRVPVTGDPSWGALAMLL